MSVSLSDDWRSLAQRRSITDSANWATLFSFVVIAICASSSSRKACSASLLFVDPNVRGALVPSRSSSGIRSLASCSSAWVCFTAFQTFLFFVAMSLAPIMPFSNSLCTSTRATFSGGNSIPTRWTPAFLFLPKLGRGCSSSLSVVRARACQSSAAPHALPPYAMTPLFVVFPRTP